MESTPGSFSKNCYDKANEAFTNDNYQKAIELYSDALSHDPCNVDYLCSRAHAYIKNDEFEKAKTDGNKAIGKKIYITCELVLENPLSTSEPPNIVQWNKM